MIRLDDGRCIIGFDDGYQLGKTANFVFDNGVHMLGSAEPTLKENSLFYDGEYFKVGEGRAAITEDKVSDDTARLRTMAGIAMELRREGLCKAEIVLVTGLPFSNYGRDKLKLIDYYNRQSVLDFSYEGEDYSVTIAKVIVCPQCYSAIASRLGNMKGDYLVVDIGSKTTDVVFLRNGLPVESRSVTIEKAMVKWMRQIQGNLQVQYGKNIPESELLKVILKEPNFLPRAYANLIRDTIREQIHSLELELEEREYDLRYTNVIYVGGGAAAMRNFSEHRENAAYDTDIHANAKGYEFLAVQIWKKQEVR